jgi:hypothetical protein
MIANGISGGGGGMSLGIGGEQVSKHNKLLSVHRSLGD